MFTTYYWDDESRRVRWVGHVAREEKRINVEKIFVEVSEGSFTLTDFGSRSQGIKKCEPVR